MLKVGFVGLGVMGGQMAAHVFRAGHQLKVWNRSPERRKPLAEIGVHVAESLEDLARTCDTIAICVNRTEDVEQCLAEIQPVAMPGTLIVDHTTILPTAAVDMHARMRSHGLRFVDAPITGGSMGAKNGTLTIFCGGEELAVEAAMPLMRCYAKSAERVGGPGAGQMMKAVNQIAVAGALLALCESLAFAEKSGLDLEQCKRLVGSGAAGSWAFENYGPKILNRDWSPGFTVDNQLKDLDYCREMAEQIGAHIPGTRLTADLLGRLQSAGRGSDTTAALFEVLAGSL